MTNPPELVLEALRSVLGGDAPPLTAETDLFDVRGFDSIALAALVDELEARVGAPLPDELIVPEVFATPALIADRLIGPALRGEAS